MEEEGERTKRWEGDYERTWEVLKEDETGSLKASVDDIILQAKRRKLVHSHGKVRLGMMRHMFVVIDASRNMIDQDLKPSRLVSSLKLLELFVEEFFYQNPISQVGFITTRNKRAELLTELGGMPKKHRAALQKAVEIQCLGEPSLYNSLYMALQTLRHVPSHSSREVLVVLGSLTTCDPFNLRSLMKTLNEFKVRVSVIGLSAEVHICTLLAQETGGTYHVILDEPHFKELLMYHVTPPPVTNMESSLIRMGFPQFSAGTVGDGADKPSFNMAQLESQGDVSLTLGGYFCPQCCAKYGQLPVECKICGLTLASASHLARSYHHLFPLEAFEETSLENISGDRVCEACQVQLTEQQVCICPECKAIFCLDCNLFIHESLHCCPGCIHSQS